MSIPLRSAVSVVSRSSAGPRPKSSSAGGRSSTVSRRTSSSARADELADPRDRLRADLRLERLQPEQDRGERLPGLVVQLAREPLALELLPLEQRLHGLAADALRELERDRGAVREGLRDAHVGVREARVGAALVVGDDDADRPAVRDQRHVERRGRLDQPRRGLVDLGVVDQRVDALGAAAARASGRPSSAPRRAAGRRASPPFSPLAASTVELAPVRGREQDQDDARVEQLAQPRRRELEQLRELRSPSRAPPRPRSATRAAATTAAPPRTGGRSRSRPPPARRAAGRSPRRAR